jgi:hypothetical protein
MTQRYFINGELKTLEELMRSHACEMATSLYEKLKTADYKNSLSRATDTGRLQAYSEVMQYMKSLEEKRDK